MHSLVDQLHPLVLNVGFAVHDSDWNWKNVNSPFIRLYYITEGTAQIELPGGIHTLRPHHLYFIPAFTPHSYICDSYFCHYYLHLYEEYGANTNLLDEWQFPFEVPADKLHLSLIRRLCDINPHMSLQKSDPSTYDNNSILVQNLLKNKQRALCDKVESRGIVFQLLSPFFKYAFIKDENKDERIGKALSYIRKHIHEDISLPVLAEHSCLSKDHFIRLFKRETGVTPSRYINRKKIEKAQLLLVTEDLPVKGIALALAFEDYSYFNRLFKKLTGTTPQAYRDTCR